MKISSQLCAIVKVCFQTKANQLIDLGSNPIRYKQVWEFHVDRDSLQ